MQKQGDARERVLDAAEALFMERGYNVVTLRDIAEALQIKQASLYYHFPEGKEQLFVAVAFRTFQRHRHGMEEAIEAARPNLRSRLTAIAYWFSSQPPLNLMGMLHADMPSLSDQERKRLGEAAYQLMFTPLRMVFAAAQKAGETRNVHPDLLAGFFLTLLDSLIHAEGQPGAPTRRAMIAEIVTLMLDGVAERSPPSPKGFSKIYPI